MVLTFILAIPFIAESAPQAEEEAAKPAEELELLVPGELSVATEGTYPPFSMVDDKGELYGLEIGVMKEICKCLNLEYEPVIMKWDSLLIGLFGNQYDIISAGMDITEERQKKVVFIDAWIESGGKLCVHQDSPIHELEDIKGKVVGALVASTMAEAAEKLGAAEVKYYKSEMDAIQDLANENIDGVVQDAIAEGWVIKKANLPLRIVPKYLNPSQKGFAVKPGKPNLVKAMNKALAEIIADGTYAKIVVDLIGFDAHPKDPIRSILEGWD